MSSDHKPHSHIPYGKEGTGHYINHTPVVLEVAKAVTPNVLEALECVRCKPTDGVFTMCDYGAADGGASIFLFNECIDQLKAKYGKDQQIQVIYEDQAVNDFKSVFCQVQGLIPGPASYYKQHAGVFVQACGTSFFSQCLPSNTLHFGYSSLACHYLSKSPGPLDDAIRTELSSNNAMKKAFAEQSAIDWEQFLLHRAAELKSGGRMIINSVCVDENGYYVGKSGFVKYSMFDIMTECLAEMVAEKKITEEEQKNIYFINYFKNEAELRSPFTQGHAVLKAGLRLISFSINNSRCPYNVKWLQGNKSKDDRDAARAHAKSFIPTIRSWSNYVFKSGLSNTHSDCEKSALVDEIFQKYEDRVAAEPDDHALDIVYAYMDIEKL